MPSAEKRRRQKENTARAREEREAAERRARTKKNAIRIGVVVLIAVAVLVVIRLTRDGGDDVETTSETTTDTTDTTGTTETTADELDRDAILAEAGCDPAVPEPGPKGSYDAPEQVLDDGVTYTATIETSCGTIVVELDNANAPDGANNFAFLAMEGFYDGLSWHRVVDDFVIQGGDPQGTGAGGPGYQVATELPSGYAVGDLAWAKAGTDPDGTAGSQFFVVTGENGAALPPQYGRFGTVVEGIEVAQLLESFNEGDGPPTVDLYIESVTVEPAV